VMTVGDDERLGGALQAGGSGVRTRSVV